MKYLFSLFLISAFIGNIQGQIDFGVKFGISSYDLANEGFNTTDGNNNLKWKLSNAGYGHHFGIYTRLTVLGVFLEPSVLFNSNTVQYNIQQYGESGVVNVIKNEKYNHLDIPVMAGFKVGILRFQGGVVGHLFINSSSDIVDFDGYSSRFQSGTYGWQAGTGLDIWKLRFDLNYEGNLSRFGKTVSIGGKEYALSDGPSRLLFTLGFKF